MKLKFSRNIFENSRTSNSINIHYLESRISMRTDVRKKDRYDEANSFLL